MIMMMTNNDPIKARGVSSSQAAVLISTIGASNSLGRLVSGWVCDQVRLPIIRCQ